MTAVARSIKTTYAGVLFMSTLEADWAKTLDAMRVRWEYEPEGIKLHDGQNYRPDFYLPAIKTWLEVKGPHDARIDKIGLLAQDCLHAPGCGEGRPIDVFEGSSGEQCACGFGVGYPWRQVIIGRPAKGSRMVYAGPRCPAFPDPEVVALNCPICKQFCFVDTSNAPICRRCHNDVAGVAASPSGSLPFRRNEPPRGRRTAGGKR